MSEGLESTLRLLVLTSLRYNNLESNLFQSKRLVRSLVLRVDCVSYWRRLLSKVLNFSVENFRVSLMVSQYLNYKPFEVKILSPSFWLDSWSNFEVRNSKFDTLFQFEKVFRKNSSSTVGL